VRVLVAAARVLDEQGYGGMSVARVSAGAGVSRRTFYELFEDREDCFLALFEDAVARATEVAHDAVLAVGRDDWCGRVRAGLAALLRFADDEPALGVLLVVDALGGGPKVLARRAGMLQALNVVVDEGRRRRGVKAKGSDPPPLTAEGVVGAVLSVIHARLLERAADPPVNGDGITDESSSSAYSRSGIRPLIDLLNPLMGMIVLPYRGRAAADKELARAAPKVPRAPRVHSSPPRTPPEDPLQGLEMRLTYRTLLVLSAIAEAPGASNRQVADVAGVHDQGQISKLLSRLERLGLIENTGAGQPNGEPNAWTLTTKGAQVEQALRPSSGC
jgi:AcrR family transcriptional regulator